MTSGQRLKKLSWRARGVGGICTAEVDKPIRGFRISQKNWSNPFAVSLSEGSSPVVAWIRYDGETYWVGLSSAQGWPRTIRVTEQDVNGARAKEAEDS